MIHCVVTRMILFIVNYSIHNNLFVLPYLYTKGCIKTPEGGVIVRYVVYFIFVNNCLGNSIYMNAKQQMGLRFSFFLWNFTLYNPGSP